ncbi:MAG: glutamate-1-semialdehyde 2,1-aminomutase [Candidatus Omnitrophica bacterium]|nr:glutamate-1-semialdehyde 2,1-aminomutase [Candidatus Omnitrophota bacterium]
MSYNKSKKLFNEAQKYIPAGVNSPVRAFRGVGGTPLFIQKGAGPYLWDADGNRYVDFCASWGPLIMGHAPAGLVGKLRKDIVRGTSYGAPTAAEAELALQLSKLFPSIEKCRLVSSGTEAVMSAVRLARGFTGRQKILKIDGGYHGHVDSLLIKAGSGGATFGTPDSAGIPKELAKLTLTIPFNDVQALEAVFKKEGKSIAAFILEPVPANMGVVLPARGYLQKARAITKRYGSLLIFDEVITGCRLSAGGAQQFFSVKPDLTTLGKIIGGGFPLAAFGGSQKIMDYLAPLGPVYQAGTLSGNPVAVSASLWMLSKIKPKSFHAGLNRKAQLFFKKLQGIIDRHQYPVRLNTVGSMFTLFFTPSPVTDYASAKKADTQKYARFFHACLKQGLYTAPSQFEANFVSAAHSGQLLNQSLRKIQKALTYTF